jgi:TolB-like protein
VIPFAVQGTEPELRFLSGQIASLIIDAFSQISGMKVLAYVEVRAEAAYADGIRALGSRLGVRRMIVGELTCHNGDLHLRAELVDSVNGTQLWGMHTTCALGNGIHCAAEIAGEIVSQVLATQHLSRQRRIPVNAPPDFRGSAQVSRMNIDRKPLASSLPGPAASRIPAQSQEGVPLPRFSNEDEADSA